MFCHQPMWTKKTFFIQFWQKWFKTHNTSTLPTYICEVNKTGYRVKSNKLCVQFVLLGHWIQNKEPKRHACSLSMSILSTRYECEICAIYEDLVTCDGISYLRESVLSNLWFFDTILDIISEAPILYITDLAVAFAGLRASIAATDILEVKLRYSPWSRTAFLITKSNTHLEQAISHWLREAVSNSGAIRIETLHQRLAFIMFGGVSLWVLG